MEFKIGDRVAYIHPLMYAEGQIQNINELNNTALIALKDGLWTRYELELNYCRKIENYSR